MAINSIAKPNQGFDYPKLMTGRSTGSVVLMQQPSVGMVVVASDSFSEGHYSDSWNMANMEDYDGVVTLSNKR